MSNQDACKASLSDKEDAQAMDGSDVSPDLKNELEELTNDICRLRNERDQLQEQTVSLKAQNKQLTLNQKQLFDRLQSMEDMILDALEES